MDGITVLNVTSQEAKEFGYDVVSVLLLCTTIFLFVGVIFFITGSSYLFLSVPFVMLFFFISLLILSNAKLINTYNIYEVTIDNTVSWVELNKHYDILGQRGNIITIKEKTTDSKISKNNN